MIANALSLKVGEWIQPKIASDIIALFINTENLYHLHSRSVADIIDRETSLIKLAYEDGSIEWRLERR